MKKKKFKVVKKITKRRRIKKRLHGWQPTVGSGAIHYSHGVMDFCDDGKGNVWEFGDDDFQEY